MSWYDHHEITTPTFSQISERTSQRQSKHPCQSESIGGVQQVQSLHMLFVGAEMKTANTIKISKLTKIKYPNLML